MSLPVEIAVEGRLGALDNAQLSLLLDRAMQPTDQMTQAVTAIIADVRLHGDEAIREQVRQFDNVVLEDLEVPRSAWKKALSRVPPDLVTALETARERIAAFHAPQVPVTEERAGGPGIRLGRRPEALRTVGAYAPGGRAVYPSSVLMCAVPASLAGVDEIVVCSPPQADGAPSTVVLAACELAEVDRVFAIGGAGAVAALAFGTASVPRADKIVGPGNAYVTEAKRLLAGQIASDCHAGPSELLIVADDTADAGLIARELAAQAEHDPQAFVAVVAIDPTLPQKIRTALDRCVTAQPRQEIIRAALARRGALLTADDRDAACEFASALAPEHLLLLLREPRRAMAHVRGAGSIFLGPNSSIAFGDYLSGTNHVLPTGGHSRSASGLSVADFVRWSSYQEIDHRGAATLAEPTAIIAEAEGLSAHAAAARAAGAYDPGTSVQRTISRDIRPRPEYASLTTYDPGRRPVAIDLTDNTNLFGQAPSAARELGRIDGDIARRYPTPYAAELKVAAAEFFGVREECIATGCGSDDLIDSAIRAFVRPGEHIVFPRPTFSMIEVFAQMNGVAAVGVALDRSYELDVDGLVAPEAPLTYLCRPNNPTGNAFDRRSVEGIVQQAAGIVIIDEAYGDFIEDPLASWAATTERVVVLRTMSKAFGLAGLRVGMAVGPPALIAEIEKSRGPYKINSIAEAAASAALLHDAGWLAETVEEAVNVREKLAAGLVALGLDVFPSAANFLLVATPDHGAKKFADLLAAAGIGVRPFPSLLHAGDCVRITVGPWPLMEQLLDQIRTAVAR